MDKDLKFTDLRLLPGAKLDLRSEQFSAIRGISRYVGFDGKYIAVSRPVVNGKLVQCKPDMEIILRFFVNHLNCVCAFRTKIVALSNFTGAVLILKQPKTMEVGEVRNSVRAKVSIECKVNSHEEFRPSNQLATIVNLSSEGARLESETFLGDKEDIITFSCKLNVLDLEKLLSVKGIIRASSNDEGKFSYGIELLDVDQTSKLLIYAYVLSHIK